MTDRPMRLRRSQLAVPGSSEKMLTKAAASAADHVFCDLEDAVAPSAKPAARETIAEALNNLDWGQKTFGLPQSVRRLRFPPQVEF